MSPNEVDFVRVCIQQRYDIKFALWKAGLLPKGHGEHGVTMDRETKGVGGEAYTRKGFDLYNDGSDTDWRTADFQKIEVRTVFKYDHHLVCYDSDKNDWQLLLVVIEPDLSAGEIIGHMRVPVARKIGFRPGPHQVRAGSAPQIWVPSDSDELRQDLTRDDFVASYRETEVEF